MKDDYIDFSKIIKELERFFGETCFKKLEALRFYLKVMLAIKSIGFDWPPVRMLEVDTIHNTTSRPAVRL